MTQTDIGKAAARSRGLNKPEKEVFATSNRWLRGDALLPTPGRQISAAAKSYEEALRIDDTVENSSWYVSPFESSADPSIYGVLNISHGETASTRQTDLRENLRQEITGLLSSHVSNRALMQLLIRLQHSPDRAAGLLRFQQWLETVSKSLADPSEEESIVLDEFSGYVDHVEDATAFVVLETAMGEELYGEYPADDLAALGIYEHCRFKCRTIEIGDLVEIRFEAIPEKKLTIDGERTIRQEVEDLLADGILDGDD